MVSYFLDENSKKNGSRTVRSATCPELPDFYDRVYLGEYERVEPAMKKASLHHAIVCECAGCRARQLAGDSFASTSGTSTSLQVANCPQPLMVKDASNR